MQHKHELRTSAASQYAVKQWCINCDYEKVLRKRGGQPKMILMVFI